MASLKVYTIYVSIVIFFVSISETKTNNIALQPTADDILLKNLKLSISTERGLSSLIRPSIFNDVPPFIKFAYFSDQPIFIPESIRVSLKWCRSVKLVNDVARATGFQIVSNKHCSNWVGFFSCLVSKARNPKRVITKPYQKYNQLPGTHELCNKDRLWLNARNLIKKFGFSEFDFFFESYALPVEIFQFYQRNLQLCSRNKMEEGRNATNNTWIYKPSRGSASRGVMTFTDLIQLPLKSKFNSAIVQKFLSNSFKIDGLSLKFRLYIVVTSVHPLRIYVYNDGDTYLETFPNTNNSTLVGNNEIKNHFADLGFDIKKMEDRLDDSVIKIMLIAEKKIKEASRSVLSNKYNGYQFWSADYIFDANGVPFLMEVNRYASLMIKSEVSARVRIPLITDTLNLAGYHFPPTMSKEGRTLLESELRKLSPLHTGSVVFNDDIYSLKNVKHDSQKRHRFNKLGIENRTNYLESIIQELDLNEVHDLMVAEDEMERIGNFKRIFPTNKTYRYLKYLESEPYYYMLQDAWEHRYSMNRSEGIKRLQKLHEIL